jgi:hypothetical protein
MFQYVLIGAGVLVGLALLLVAFAALRPGAFRVERSARVASPPEVVFEQVDVLRNWEAWSPWAKRDPNMRMTYDGPPSGPGASYHWLGNREVGEGRMTITDSVPGELVRFRLDFLKPIRGTNTAEFTFAPADGDTVVTWAMWGTYALPAKVVGLLLDMDKMIGGDFERGLASIKSITEGAAVA